MCWLRIPVCVGRVLEGRRRGYRLAAASFTRNLIPIPFLFFSLSLSPSVVISGFIIQKWRGMEIERSTGKSIERYFSCAFFSLRSVLRGGGREFCNFYAFGQINEMGISRAFRNERVL